MVVELGEEGKREEREKSVMCGEERQWSCGGRAGSVNLRKVSSIVRDIGDPCLSHSPVKAHRVLKPDKWQGMFDSEGKLFGFQKALKLIVLGGVDPSIRPEVWEFLLGCYALSSTTEYRRSLRAARREHYRDLIKQCQAMHSSVGTGSLAYVVGSKVMDMRTSSRDDRQPQAKIGRLTSNNNNIEVGKHSDGSITCTEAANASQRESSNNCVELVGLRTSTDTATYNSSVQQNCSSPNFGRESDASHYEIDSCFDFPPLPVTNLFEKSGKDEWSGIEHGDKFSAQHKLSFEGGRMHSFQISNNEDLVIESNGQQPLSTLHAVDSEIEIASLEDDEPEFLSSNPVYESGMINQLKISDVPQPAIINTSIAQGWSANEDKVSEWLWTLHRIVVDVVRTDSHLEFYEDRRNLARMSDILAVYAWVDPATGYCQGMSDLLSPFVVIFEDNADAFWCFEMLLRRMRENFQMEGPTRVMKQLRAIWHILEMTDKEMFAHLAKIGAESLHFAFRMLLVLFRRELSFTESLSMWEMMWAADFEESLSYDLKEKCLKALDVHLPRDSIHDTREESADPGDGSVKSGSQSKHNQNHSKNASLQSNHVNTDHSVSDVKLKSLSSYAFCGLARSIWPSRHGVQMGTISSKRRGNDELSIFCVAAILVLNRQKIIRETFFFFFFLNCFAVMIQIFNDNMLKINVKRCITTAIKLRKKYLNKVIRKRKYVPEKED
ncbi:small G protein signaling modulator 1 isoform X1 [Arachis ipaensis]|uniref:small G protein signaling modulator 1 isoform X1 n=1 Tax=Arachis ipaensis TaxID=130454 RepID=UPI000A2B7D59|nr:small G protein signaling modulator 1 isoform X1 [Arachis ipaensis]XP_020964186.1 small G protein signaling modulator 1 isoform X1 [Arachis ipaensis]